MTYAIAEAAHRSGLSIDTLRYYERIELIVPPARDSGGRRAYSEDDINWLVFLTKLRTTGMPIRLMREYARLRNLGIGTAGARKKLLIEHRVDVQARIEDLRACLDILNHKIINYERCELDLVGVTVEEATA